VTSITIGSPGEGSWANPILSATDVRFATSATAKMFADYDPNASRPGQWGKFVAALPESSGIFLRVVGIAIIAISHADTQGLSFGCAIERTCLFCNVPHTR
jgi:hypothetical protein